MPADHGIGFDDLQRVQNAGSPPVKPSEHHSVDAREGEPPRRLAAQYVQLVPEYQNLGFQ
jgi:hypothetical protein